MASGAVRRNNTRRRGVALVAVVVEEEADKRVADMRPCRTSNSRSKLHKAHSDDKTTVATADSSAATIDFAVPDLGFS